MSPAAPRSDDGLAVLGLRAGDTVRWKPAPGGRWRMGRVGHRERDGSVAVTDGRGLSRSLAVERLEVAGPGRRGSSGWEPLSERAARAQQLRLL